MVNKLWPFLLISTCTFFIVCSSPTKRSGQKLCGKMLVQALELACDNQYYDPNSKRSYYATGRIASDSYPTWDMTSSEGEYFLEPRKALAFLHRPSNFVRVTRGVSDECCKKSCTYNELLSYCFLPSR